MSTPAPPLVTFVVFQERRRCRRCAHRAGCDACIELLRTRRGHLRLHRMTTPTTKITRAAAAAPAPRRRWRLAPPPPHHHHHHRHRRRHQQLATPLRRRRGTETRSMIESQLMPGVSGSCGERGTWRCVRCAVLALVDGCWLCRVLCGGVGYWAATRRRCFSACCWWGGWSLSCC